MSQKLHWVVATVILFAWLGCVINNWLTNWMTRGQYQYKIPSEVTTPLMGIVAALFSAPVIERWLSRRGKK